MVYDDSQTSYSILIPHLPCEVGEQEIKRRESTKMQKGIQNVFCFWKNILTGNSIEAVHLVFFVLGIWHAIRCSLVWVLVSFSLFLPKIIDSQTEKLMPWQFYFLRVQNYIQEMVRTKQVPFPYGIVYSKPTVPFCDRLCFQYPVTFGS